MTVATVIAGQVKHMLVMSVFLCFFLSAPRLNKRAPLILPPPPFPFAFSFPQVLPGLAACLFSGGEANL